VGDPQGSLHGCTVLKLRQYQYPRAVLVQQRGERLRADRVLIADHGPVTGKRQRHRDAAQWDWVMAKAGLVETFCAGDSQDMLAEQIIAEVGGPHHVVPQAAQGHRQRESPAGQQAEPPSKDLGARQDRPG
jgi:hypothetical protein